jgi:hypothetical protein
MSKISDAQKAYAEYKMAMEAAHKSEPQTIKYYIRYYNKEHEDRYDLVEYMPDSNLVFIGEVEGTNHICLIPEVIPELIRVLSELIEEPATKEATNEPD